MRKLVNKGITLNAFQNDEEKILADMQAALKTVLDPQVERLVKVSVKNSIASSMNLLCTAAFMSRLATNENSRKKLDALIAQARRLGIAFVQQGQGSIDEYLKESLRQIDETWDRE